MEIKSHLSQIMIDGHHVSSHGVTVVRRPFKKVSVGRIEN